VGDFHQLMVWQKSHQLALDVYRISTDFPKSEVFGLTSQARRAAVSIPANIAEGCGRGGDPEFARFLRISLGSASELEYHLLLAQELGYLDKADYATAANATGEVKGMLRRLLAHLSTRDHSLLTTHDPRLTTHDP
jgi:four helix bundle protein